MKCPKCHYDNEPEANFCLECGARLEFSCPSCGKTLPASAKFCSKCGHKLSPFLEAPPIDPSAPRTYTPKHFKESRQATRMAWLSMSNALKKEAGPSLTLPEEMRMRN